MSPILKMKRISIGVGFSFCLAGSTLFADQTITLRSGNSTLGSNPQGALLLGIDGNFYGTTAGDGVTDDGTVFKMTHEGVVTTLVEFTGTTGSNLGSEPLAVLAQTGDGYFYGTTFSGGTSDFGTVFRMAPDGTLTTLVNFTGTSGSFEGRHVRGALIMAADGNFYGTTALGGSLHPDKGTVFRMTPGGSFLTIHEYRAQGQGSGSTPYAALTQGIDGDFYGTNFRDATNNVGALFKLTTDGITSTL